MTTKVGILAIIQARTSSSRLPGKVLKPILGKPMLELHIERLLRCKKIDKLIVATSEKQEDGAIESLCNKLGIFCYRGDLDNVLDRFYKAAEQFCPNHVVRLTGDCPLADPSMIDALIDFYLEKKCDYATNCDPASLPDGLDAEVFSFDAIKKAWNEAKLPSELEHVTPYIRNHPEKFKIESWINDEDLSSLRWTVDEPEDFEFVTRVYELLYPHIPDFDYRDILSLMDKYPDLRKINQGFIRNEGMEKSLKMDAFLKNKPQD